MYEELITALRTCVDKEKGCDECPYYGKCMKTVGKHAAMMDAADAIEELQAGEKKLLRNISALEMENENLKRAGRWIPVTERLPVKGMRVLCACRANIFCVLKWDGIDWVENPTHVYMRGFVTHWMPLPTPPKEET